MAAASDALVSCAHNPDFAAVCSFLEQFGDKFGIVFPTFYDLQQLLECSTQISQVLVELHVKLLRRLKRSASMDRWENAIIKFAYTYSQQDAWELERFGYLNANLNVKIRLLKNLLETQFDRNPKFKAEINALSSQDLRLQSLGRDRHGYRYWHLLDDDCNLRVYREDMDDETWELVASDKNSMLKLIETLASEANQITPPEATPEDSNSQDFLDTGQKSPPELSQETPITSSNLSENNVNAQHSAANVLLPLETNPAVESGEVNLNSERPSPGEERNVPAVLSEAVEAPLLVVRGDGSGAECETGNPGQDEEEPNHESQDRKEEEFKKNEGDLVRSSSDSSGCEKEGNVTVEVGEQQVREPEVEEVENRSEDNNVSATAEPNIHKNADLGEDQKGANTAVLTEECRTGVEVDNHSTTESESKNLIQEDNKESEPENVVSAEQTVASEKKVSIQVDDKEPEAENLVSAEQNYPSQESSDSLKASEIGDSKENLVKYDERTKEVVREEDKGESKKIVPAEEPRSPFESSFTTANDRKLETGEENPTPCDPEVQVRDESNDHKCIGMNIASSEGFLPPQYAEIDEKTVVLDPCSVEDDIKSKESLAESAKASAVDNLNQQSPSALIEQMDLAGRVTKQENQNECQKTTSDKKNIDSISIEQNSLVADSSTIPRNIKEESPMEQDADHVKEEETGTTGNAKLKLRVPEQRIILPTAEPQTRVKEELTCLGSIDEKPDATELSRERKKSSESRIPAELSSVVKEELNLELKKEPNNTVTNPSQSTENCVGEQETKTISTPEENLTERDSCNSIRENDEKNACLNSAAQLQKKDVQIKQPEPEKESPIHGNPELVLDMKQNDIGSLTESQDIVGRNESSGLKLSFTDNVPVPEAVSSTQGTPLDSRNGISLTETLSSHIPIRDQKQEDLLQKVEVTEEMNTHDNRTRAEDDTPVLGQDESNHCLGEEGPRKEEIQLSEKPEPVLMSTTLSELPSSHVEDETNVGTSGRTKCAQQVEPKTEPVLPANPIQDLSDTEGANSEARFIGSKTRTAENTVMHPLGVTESKENVMKTHTVPAKLQTSFESPPASSGQLTEPCDKAEEALCGNSNEKTQYPAEVSVKHEELTSKSTSDSKNKTAEDAETLPQSFLGSEESVLKTDTVPVIPQTSVGSPPAASGQLVEPYDEALSGSFSEKIIHPAEVAVKHEMETSDSTSEHPVKMENNPEGEEILTKNPVVEANDKEDCKVGQHDNVTPNTKLDLGNLAPSVEPSRTDSQPVRSNCVEEDVAKEPGNLSHSPLPESKPSESELVASGAAIQEVQANVQIKGQEDVFVNQEKSDHESQEVIDEDQKLVQVTATKEVPILRQTDLPVKSVKLENERLPSCLQASPNLEQSSSLVEDDSSKLVIVAQETEGSVNQIRVNEEPNEVSDIVLAPEKTEEKDVIQDSKSSEVSPAPEVEELKEFSKERDIFYNDTSNSSSNSLQIAASESLPPSPTKNEEGLNGPTEPSPGSTSTDENSKSNLIHKQEDFVPKRALEDAQLRRATPPNLEEDRSNLPVAPPFCRSPEIHSENATTDSKFQELVEKFQAVGDGDEATLSNKVGATESSKKISSSRITDNSPSKGMHLTSFSMDYHGETGTPLQETLSLLKQNEKKSKLEEDGTSEERKEPVLRKRRGRRSNKRLTADALVMLNASEEASKEATPRGCRQSLRIAKLKEREDDERRAVEEERLKRLKDEFERREKRRQEREARKVRMEEKAKKKDQQGLKKKRKRSSEDDSDFSAGEKKMKKKKKKNIPWDSSDSSSESSSSEDDLEALQQAAEEEEELVFKSDHEFSPESDIGEEETAPTRHARTARKKIKKWKADQMGEGEDAEEEQEDDEEDEEEVDESSCQKCGQGDNPEWILLCDNCDGGWHVSCLKPALMMIPAGDWYCPPCEHVMLMEKLQERLEAYEYLLQQRDADIKAKEELEAAANLVAAEEETDDLDRRENDEGEDFEEEEGKEDGKTKKKKSKSDEDESAPEEGEEEEDDESGEEEESAISEEKSEEEDGEEPVYRLRDRRGAQQPAYNFKAYDEMIKSAIQGDDQEEQKASEIDNEKEGEKEATPSTVSAVAPPPVSKGKGPRSDEDSDEDFSRLVRRKKKARKLNDLDATSSDDSKDTDFKGSSASDDEEDEWEAEEEDSDDDFIVDESDDSDVVVFKGRDRRNAEPSVRRSTRKRAPRYKMDSDSDTSEESAGAAWNSGESSESSSDASWGGGRKRRKIAKKPAPVRKPPVKKSPAPKKKSSNTVQKRGRRKTQSGSDSNEESFKPRGKKTKATPRQEPEEDTAASRRTRGKKVSYRALISSEDSVSEDEPPKRPPPERKSIRPPVATASVVTPPAIPQLAAPPSPSPSQADEDEDLHLSAAEAIAEEEAEAGRADSPWDDQDAVLPSSQTATSLPDDLDPSGNSSSTGMGSDVPLPVPMDNAVIQHALSALATPPTVPPMIPVGLPVPVLTQATPVHIPRTLDVQRMLHDPPPPPASLSPKLNRMPPEMHVSRLIQQTPPTPTSAINPLALRNSLPPEEVSSLRKLDLFAASDLSKARDDPHLKMDIPHTAQGASPYPVVKPPPLLMDPNPRSFLNVIKVPEPRGGVSSNRLPPVMPPLYAGSPKASPLPEGVIRPSPYIPPPPYSAEPRPYAAAPAPASPHPSHVQPPSHPPNQFLPQPYPGYGPPRLSYAPPPPRPYPYPMHPYIRTPGFQHAGFPTAFATEEERRIFRVAQPPRDYVFERGDPTLSSAPPPAVPVLEEPQPKDTPPSSVANPAPSEAEESEFGGLVSYFSSQQEDFDS